ncbi:MAG: tetratricopeptide repeat protein [Planctomycetota bacterium]
MDRGKLRPVPRIAERSSGGGAGPRVGAPRRLSARTIGERPGSSRLGSPRIRLAPISRGEIKKGSYYFKGRSSRRYYRASYSGLGLSLGLSWGIGNWGCDYYSGLYRYSYLCHRFPWFYACYGYSPWFYRPYYVGYWLSSFYPIWWDPYWYRDGGNTYNTYNYYDDSQEGGGVATVGAPPERPSSVSAYRASSPAALAEHYVELGDLYMRTRRYKRAVESYLRAVKLVDNDGSLRFVLADALFQTGEYDRAAYQIRQGLHLDPSLAGAIVDKRSFYDWPQDLDKELDKLRSHLAEHPFDTEARLLLAYNLRLTNQFAAARKELMALAEQLPGDTATKLLLDGLDDAEAKSKQAEKHAESRPGKSDSDK